MANMDLMKLPSQRPINFKLHLQRPGSIHSFDDSDVSEYEESEHRGLSLGLTAADSSKAVCLQKSVPNHLLLVSMLEQLCMIYSKHSHQAQNMFLSLCDQLTRRNAISPLIGLDEMSSLRSQYRLSVHRMLVAALNKASKDTCLPLQSTVHGQMMLPSSIQACQPFVTEADMINLQTSRYATEFIEQDKIGKGGFGSVYKAKNKLDGKMYAVKQITFKHSNPGIWLKVLREVKALANLQHSNIVGYNSCWLEYSTSLSKSSDHTFKIVETKTEDVFMESTEDSNIIFIESKNAHGSDFFEDQDDGSALGSTNKELSMETSVFFSNQVDVYHTEGDVEYQENAEISETAGNFHVLSDQSQSKSDLKTFETVTHSGQQSSAKNLSMESVMPGESTWPDVHSDHSWNISQRQFSIQKTVTLYIQMELCSLTLKDWMHVRNSKCKSEAEFDTYTGTNMQIFRQILKAVEYIHSQGVMHRDLKPRNVFLHEDGLHVKVGDFGLATDDIASPTEEEEIFLSEPNSQLLSRTGSTVSEDHTSGVGTSTYAAPEQLEGSVYNTKCDIYSLGVILFEMFQQYNTEMERYTSLDKLRSGNIPPSMTKNWPDQAKAITQMTCTNPDNRNTARELLNSELFLSKEKIISDLQKEKFELQKQVGVLQRLLKDKDQQIVHLKHELANTCAFPGTFL